jgi:RNA polymerase sigma-70 factor, ECF subfamily
MRLLVHFERTYYAKSSYLFTNGPGTGNREETGKGEMATAATVEQGIWAAAEGLTPPLRGNHRLDQSFDLDLRLVERCLAGDETAWEDLVKTHTRRVYAICYRFTGTDSEAQDLTQDVFLRLFKTLRTFRAGEGSFTVWLTRMTRNLLIDNYRRTKQNRVTDSIEDQLPMLEERSAGHGGRADGLLAGREASEILQGALQKLSPELRETVILRDLEELDYKEIAAVLNVPEGTVKSRLNRGRAELARLLKKYQVALV